MSVYIIAEAGVNHNGSIELARRMMDEAVAAGADCIKFQTFKAENLATKCAVKAEYQKETTGSEEGQLAMLRRLELRHQDYTELASYCKNRIDFLSTPFDLDSLRFLASINMKFWKIPSGEITNYPYLVEIAKTGKPVIMSTGMSELSEIDEAIRVLKAFGCGEITLLHCNTQYPTPFEDVNLLAMKTLKERYGVKVGYSDHTQGIEAPIAAVALGAEVIEKHFTLDKNMEGPDHKASLEPSELKSMVASIRNIERALGSGEKKVSSSEEPNKVIARKSIVAKANIRKGELLSVDNITTKRPGSGISPMRWNELLGTRAIRDFAEDEMIEV